MLTLAYHKRLINEGKYIVDRVNDRNKIGDGLSLIVGDIEAPKARLFWFKLQCIYCGDFDQLCLPK